MVSILLTYLLVTIAVQMYAGVGDEGLGLGNAASSENVFGALAGPILGSPLDMLLFLAVLASSAASLMTTFLPTSRTMLAMGVYRALPQRFTHVHPAHKTPSFATLLAGIAAGTFCTVLNILSENVLVDTIFSLGILICFSYALTAFGCVWYFRRELFASAYDVTFKLVFPLLGGIGLLAVLVVTLRDSADPAYKSGASIGGVGLVLVLGLGLIVLGAAVMVVQRVREPAFFLGQTLTSSTAPLVVDEEDASNMQQ